MVEDLCMPRSRGVFSAENPEMRPAPAVALPCPGFTSSGQGGCPGAGGRGLEGTAQWGQVCSVPRPVD